MKLRVNVERKVPPKHKTMMFPWIGVSTLGSGTTVLFTSPGMGIALRSSPLHPATESVVSGWDMPLFEPLVGSVTLTQE
jgi:hypothetical protein